jgi:methyltransferase family protein
MSGFSADWLALREPYDRTARNAEVIGAVAAAFAGQSDLAVVDLACGTGSTLRAIAPHLPARQSWRLVDNDLGLLLRAGAAAPALGIRVTTTPVDLARDLEAALDGPVDLVTTSALLDLVSDDWLKRLVVEIAARNLPIYAALSYDGRATLDPSDPADAGVLAGLNRHQRTDKGFGPALGPAAAAAAVTRFAEAGYSVVQGKSDWVLGSADREMQLELLTGWVGAAREIGELSLADLVAWLTRRRDLVAAGRSKMRVGHVDFFATPTGTR